MRKSLIGFCAVGALGIAVYAMREAAPTVQSVAVAPLVTKAAPQAAFIPAARPQAGTARVSPATPATSKSAEFDQLANSKDPRDSLRAYMTAMLCVWPAKEYRQAELTASGERSDAQAKGLADGSLKAAAHQACGDLTEQQINSRRQYMEIAAEAGVPQAALYLVQEGPFGDPSALDTRPKDPAVLAWRARMVDLISLAAKKGDVMSMQSLSNMYATGVGIIDQPDPVKALEYATAWQTVYHAQTGKRLFNDRLSLTSKLTADQVAAADAAGTLLAQTVIKGAQQ